jgi:hypothetical protein
MHFFDDGHGRQIEHCGRRVPRVRRKAMTRALSESNSMNPRRIGDVAKDFARRLIDDHDVRAARDVHSAGLGIGSEIVSASFAASRELLDFERLR